METRNVIRQLATVATAVLAGVAALAGPAAAESQRGASTVAVWFAKGERLVEVKRVQRVDGALGDALQQLVAGPTRAERARGLRTSIPSGTRLRAVTGTPRGIVTVDLSRRFEAGGGSASMRARVAQLVYTATQFRGVKGIRIALDGKVVDHIGGEGVPVRGPLTRKNLP